MIRENVLADGRWVDAMRSAIGDVRRAPSGTNLEDLRERVVALAWRSDCPSAASVSGARENVAYQRHLIAGEGDGTYQALLIAWPPDHRTPLHDHDGLWGIELVLDGALAVDEYKVSGGADAAALTVQRSLVLGIGDAAVFSGRDYVHSCRNLSANRIALSLHLYAGALERYATFAADGAGRYRASRCDARIDSAWI